VSPDPHAAAPGDGSAPSLIRLDGRRVIVAGAGGGGIGTTVCRFIAEAGASVTALDVDPERLPDVEAALAGTPGEHRTKVVDLLDTAQVERAVDEAASDGPPLYGLVQVAGGLFTPQWAPIAKVAPDVIDDVFALNFKAAVLTSRAVARHLVDAGTPGSIVAIASVAGLLAMPYGFAYSASKAALMSFVRSAAIEWGSEGVRINAVAPGSINTPKSRRGAPVAADDNPAERAAVPLERRGRSEDIAGAVLFLLSDLASWVTGQTLPVDGGNSIRPSFLDEENLPVFVHIPEIRAIMRGGPDGGGR
jgi:NAD(P)-dependent dehydrogenase (short-subunit alcohol dehydrogenase family)